MLYAYRQYLNMCEAQGIAPTPMSADQTRCLFDLLQNPPAFEEAVLVDLLINQVNDEAGAAAVRTEFLQAIAAGTTQCPLIGPKRAQEILSS
jgi:aconitate hydratase 2/2-methylisocitrate dehydratase